MDTRLGSTLSIFLCIGQLVHASPHVVRQEITPPASTEVPQGGSSNAFKTAWIPVVAFFGAVIALVLFYKFLWPKFSRPPTTSTTTTTTTPTADAILSAGQGSNTTTDGAAPPRRRRRQRRPSQISTRSLPAYMLEAGDNEITLDRSRNEPEDDSEDDSDGDSPGHQRTDSDSTDARRSTDGVNMNTPLLNNPTNQGEEAAPRPSMDSHYTRVSHTTRETDHSHIPLMTVDRNNDLAPSYFEVVGESAGRASSEPPAATTTQDPGTTTSAEAQPGNLEAGTTQHQRRQSLFRRFFSPFMAGNPETDHGPTTQQASNDETVRGHHRNASTTSFLGRYSQSGSTSQVGFHALSRDRSNSSGLPMRQMPGSAVSLRDAVISGPLPDSVVRASFSYPSNGQPTPEQVKFLSSTQSLLKYGTRLGENPNAVPPPSFDSIIGPSPSGSGAGETSSQTVESSSVPSSEDTSQSSPSSSRSPLNLSTGSSHGRRASESSNGTTVQDVSLPAVEELPTPISATSTGFGSTPLSRRDPVTADDISEFGVLSSSSDHLEAQIPLPLSRATTVASRMSMPNALVMDDFGERKPSAPESTISTARSYATAMTKQHPQDDGEDTETEESTLEKIRRRSLRGPAQLDNISLDDLSRPSASS